MTVPAIIFMIIAMVTVWGGLIAAIVNLVRHPEDVERDPEAVPSEL
jgi:hypothetical protein